MIKCENCVYFQSPSKRVGNKEGRCSVQLPPWAIANDKENRAVWSFEGCNIGLDIAHSDK